MSFKEEQAQKRLEYYQGMSGSMRPPSLMASREEKDSYTAQEVGRGNLPSSELSEAYGGRPTGTTRRAIRMQDAYDTERERQLEERASIQGMDIQLKEFEMSQRDEAMRETASYYERGLKEAEQKMGAEKLSQATAIISGLNQLDPQSPDYQKNVAVLFGRNPLGAADENVQKVASEYGAANDLYIESFEAQSEKRDKDAEEQAKLQAEMVTYGVTPKEMSGLLEPNLPAGVVRYNVNAAQPVIAAAKLRQKETEETETEGKAESKDFTSRLRDQQKALAVYNSILEPELERINTSFDTDGNPISDAKKAKEIANLNRTNPELLEALAEARGAAAVLDLPMIQNESELSKYKSGDRVLAPDGITVIMVP